MCRFGRAAVRVFVVVLVMCSLCDGASRPLTMAEMDEIEVTLPLLAIDIGQHWGALRAWTSHDGQAWTLVCRSAPYPNEPLTVYALLDEYPRYVRVGTTGRYTGAVYIDAVGIICPDGSSLEPVSAEAINRAVPVENALKKDGQMVAVSHVDDEHQGQVDAVQFEFDLPADAPEQPLTFAEVPAPPLRVGVYLLFGGDQDPYDVPPGYIYLPRAEDIAFYDFSEWQANNAALIAEVKRLNPNHKVIIRGVLGQNVVLDYCFDEETRDKMVNGLLEQLQPTENVYGIAVSEEELAHMMVGYYSTQPAQWLLKYKDNYEQETGREFKWYDPKYALNLELHSWLVEKIVFLHNDLYDRIKARHPDLKVFPAMYVPGDVSGWGWVDPRDVKADGWIYQYNGPGEAFVLKRARHTLSDINEVCVVQRRFDASVRRLRECDFPDDEIYANFWAYRDMDDAVQQIRDMLAAGVANCFAYYCHAWVPPAPVPNTNGTDLAFRVTSPDGTLEQTGHETALAVGPGRCQSFVASGDTSSISLYTLAYEGGQVHKVTIETDGGGKPGGKALASLELAPEELTAEGWVDLPLQADLTAREAYWITIRPVGETASGLRLGASDQNPYRDGEALWFQHTDGYFADWRMFDVAAPGWRENWPASYRERLRVEELARETRAQEAGSGHRLKVTGVE